MADTPNLTTTQTSIVSQITQTPVSSAGDNTTVQPKPDFVSAWTEPESAATTDNPPVYPYNNITQTIGGHSFEMDDTPTRERIRLQHRLGTFLEMHPNGDQVHKIVGDGYTITLGDHNIAIGVDDGNNAKKLNITVYGDVNMHVTGDKHEMIDGNYTQHIKGNYNQTINGIATITGLSDMRVLAGTTKLHTLKVETPRLKLKGNLDVSGSIVAKLITSKTRVDAGLGVSAGSEGFVTVTGGLSIGIPIASSFQINCVGPITSFISVSAPSMTSITNGSIIGSDIVNRLLRALHIHPAPLGMTGPETVKETAIGAGGFS
jgi:hypothetical protein